MFSRNLVSILVKRLQEPRKFIQTLTGPRQVGKTTIIHQVLQQLESIPSYFVSADEPSPQDQLWLQQQWDIARIRLKDQTAATELILVIDEIQKIQGWSETIKRLWDEDTRKQTPIKVVLLGSSSLLIQKGLTESLAGRFERIFVPHWSFAEMKQAFNLSIDQFIFFGGYPGPISIINDEMRWRRYLLDSIIETTIARDVLLLTRVDKPTLLRRLFQLGCHYSGQILSYQKMLGQLQDAGNTTTLSHYLELLSAAGMLCGLEKFSTHVVRTRASSPKLMALNTALMSAYDGQSFKQARENTDYWGRLVETSVGAHLVCGSLETDYKIFYWREKNSEVDFVLHKSNQIIAIEVKSGRKKEALPGLNIFSKHYPPSRTLLVGVGGMPVDEFLSINPSSLFN